MRYSMYGTIVSAPCTPAFYAVLAGEWLYPSFYFINRDGKRDYKKDIISIIIIMTTPKEQVQNSNQQPIRDVSEMTESMVDDDDDDESNQQEDINNNTHQDEVDEEEEEEEEEEENNVAWADYYAKISKIEGRRQDDDNYKYKKSALEMLLTAQPVDDTDKMLAQLFRASRRGFRCFETYVEEGKEPVNYSAYVRGGIDKLIDTTLVSCDEPWDYTVGLVDYVLKILEPLTAQDFDETWYRVGCRTTCASFRKAFQELDKMNTASNEEVNAQYKIHNLLLLGDLLLAADYTVIKDLALIVGQDDVRHILVPEWTRTYGTLIPTDHDLFTFGGDLLEWRKIMQNVSKIHGFEKVANTARCSPFDFFVLPPVMFAAAAYLFVKTGTPAGFTVIAIATGIFLSQELGFARDLTPTTLFERINHVTAGLGAYVLLNATVEILSQVSLAGPDWDPWYILIPAILALVKIFSYGVMWIQVMRKPLTLVTSVLADLPPVYDKNGKALYYVPKENLALSAIVEGMILAKDSVDCIRAARLGDSEDKNDGGSGATSVSNPNDLAFSQYRLFKKTKKAQADHLV